MQEQARVETKALQEQYEEQEKQIEVAQTNLNRIADQLRKDGGTIETNTTYIDGSRNLNQQIKQHRLLYIQIYAKPVDYDDPPVEIIFDPAAAPQFPMSRHFALAILLIISGLISTVAGLSKLKVSRD